MRIPSLRIEILRFNKTEYIIAVFFYLELYTIQLIEKGCVLSNSLYYGRDGS